MKNWPKNALYRLMNVYDVPYRMFGWKVTACNAHVPFEMHFTHTWYIPASVKGKT